MYSLEEDEITYINNLRNEIKKIHYEYLKTRDNDFLDKIHNIMEEDYINYIYEMSNKRNIPLYKDNLVLRIDVNDWDKLYYEEYNKPEKPRGLKKVLHSLFAKLGIYPHMSIYDRSVAQLAYETDNPLYA